MTLATLSANSSQCGRFLGAGFLGFFVALWAWRASQKKRFHITFWSGLFVLACTDVYAWSKLGSMRGIRLFVDDWELGVEKPNPYLVITQILQQTALIPLAVAYGTAAGLVLLLTALVLDRRR